MKRSIMSIYLAGLVISVPLFGGLVLGVASAQGRKLSAQDMATPVVAAIVWPVTVAAAIIRCE